MANAEDNESVADAENVETDESPEESPEESAQGPSDEQAAEIRQAFANQEAGLIERIGNFVAAGSDEPEIDISSGDRWILSRSDNEQVREAHNRLLDMIEEGLAREEFSGDEDPSDEEMEDAF